MSNNDDGDALSVGVEVIARFWKAHGLTAAAVEMFDLSIRCADDQLWISCPVHDEERREVGRRLYPLDQTARRSRWIGCPRPDVVYGLDYVLRDAPLLIVSTPRQVWRLACIGVPAVCFLCGPCNVVPSHGVSQIARVGAAPVLVIDDQVPLMPMGAGAVVHALRLAGIPAGGYTLPAMPWLRMCGWGGATPGDLAIQVGGDADALYATIAALEPIGDPCATTGPAQDADVDPFAAIVAA